MDNFIVNAVVLSSIYLLFSLGMSLLWGTVGILNFAHGSIFTLAAFSGYLAVREGLRLPLVLTVLLVIVAGAIFSALVYVLVFAPILRGHQSVQQAELQLLVGGIGVSVIPIALVQKVLAERPVFGLPKNAFVTARHSAFGLEFTNVQVVIVLVTIVVTAAVVIWLSRTRTGLALRAIGIDSETAPVMGIDPGRLALLMMTASGGLAGLAGAMLAYNLGSLSPDTGSALILKAFAIIILGGIGSAYGVIVGSVVLAACETAVFTFTSGTWGDAISFVLIAAVLLLRPQGLFGKRQVVRT